MKNRLLGVFLLMVSAIFTSVKSEYAYAASPGNGSYNSETVSEAVDLYGQYSGNLSEFSGKLADAVAGTKDDATLDNIVGTLDQVGLEGGWAKQIGSLRKIGQVFDVFSKAIDFINKVDTAQNLYDAFKAGDKETFSNIVADQITEFAAGQLSSLFTKIVYTEGMKLVVASSAGGPVSMILTGAGVFIVGWAGSYAIEQGVEWLMDRDAIRNVLVGIGDAIWDALGGKNDDDMMCKPGDNPDDPFNSNPQNPGGNSSGGEDGYHGLKPIHLF
ncbi:MAG: hypothetical protein IJR99_12970 [Kiritimatiellae bacterium]|nr:hypothetical protein [Kiritimatiellia bacterium]